MNKTIRKSPLKEGQIIPIAIDYVFTNIFNNPDNIILLENFLSCYLEMPVSELKGKVKLLNRNLILEHKKEASKQVDLLVDIKGEKINIELQNQMLAGILDRNVAFACKIHARQLKSEEKSYQKIKKTIQINLTRKTNEELKEIYYFTNKKGRVLTEKIEIVMIDMEKAKETCYTEEKLARWCKAIIARSKEELKQAVGDD